MDTTAQNKTAGFYYDFEVNFNSKSFYIWQKDNLDLCWSASVLYVIVIFGIKWYMAERKKFELRQPLAIWSGLLAVFSLFGAYRTVPNLYYALTEKGLLYSMCDNDFLRDMPTAVWSALFTTSKLYELGDTIFIVLRKQPLIFLHWYHHITVLLYVWLNFPSQPAIGRWFMAMNYFVHSIMYTYYTLRALRIHVPKWVNIVITMLQLIQMIIGLIINILAYNYIEAGASCDNTYASLKWAVLMYLSYFVLFANFFYNTYLKPKTSSSKASKGTSGGSTSKSSGHGDYKSTNGDVRHRKVMQNGAL